MPHITLKEVPAEIHQFILKTQGEMKAQKMCQYSLEKTVIKMLKDLKDLTEKKK